MNDSPAEERTEQTRATTRHQSLRGMRDLLPSVTPLYRKVENAFVEIAGRHGFKEIRTPVLEATELFKRQLGEASDVVHKEMYSFTDRSDHPVSLRPEGTAPVGRAYLEHGMASEPQPIKLFYLSSMYRYERPQAGRYREHEQAGLEVFGSPDPAMDAEVILATWQLLAELGINDVTVQVNSIGGPTSRKAIRKVITDTLRPVSEKLSADAKRQLKQNPLRVLDSKDPAVIEQVAKVPPIIDQLTAEDRDHFTQVLEYLDEVNIPYELNPRLVRGFDYYTRTVFECWGKEGAQSSYASGGRYDGLIEQLGGPPTPGVGVGIGVDRLVEHLRNTSGSAVPQTIQVFVIQLGDVAKKISFDLINQLTQVGIPATSALGKDSIRSQLKLADRLGVPLALIIGQKEAMEKTIILRDMASGMQDTVRLGDVVSAVESRIPGEVTKKHVR